MKTIKKLTLIAALLSTAVAQTGEQNPETPLKTARNEATKTILACVGINAMARQDNFIPMKAFLPAAAIIGIGMGTFKYFNDRALKKHPQRKISTGTTMLLKSLVVAAGIAPIIYSDCAAVHKAQVALMPIFIPTADYLGKCFSEKFSIWDHISSSWRF